MLIGITLLVLTILMIFSMIFGNNPIGLLVNVAIDHESIVDGIPVSYVVQGEDVLFFIDTTALLTAGIVLISAVIAVALITGIQVLGSGLSQSSVRIIILITGYVGIWSALSILAFNLIIQIEIFGSLIYIILTTGYSIGVVQKISGND